MTKLLLNTDEIIELVKSYKKIYSKRYSDYEIGVTQGLDFVLYLFEAMEK